MIEFLTNLLELSLEASPWLVLGLVIGGLIKALIPTELLQRHLSGNGFSAIFKAALFGAPLPLCSCGVIPAALGLRRAGASKPATISFLVSTPETGIDSVSISYALLGPFMAVVRPVAAIISAITAGLLVGKAEDDKVAILSDVHAADDDKASCCESEKQAVVSASCCSDEEAVVDTSCCSTQAEKPVTNSCCSSGPVEETSCCSTAPSASTQAEAGSCCSTPEQSRAKPETFVQKAWEGIVYSFVDLFDKVLFWLVIGLVFAALVKTFVPITFLAEWGSGLPAMLVMLVIGIPMYVCATASTPIAAGLLLAGVSPGTAMVFLMAGPATNISTLGVIGKELGKRSLYAYLAGVGVITLLTGFMVDYLVGLWGIDVQGQIAHSQDMVPPIIAWAALLLLIGVVLKLRFGKFFLKPVAG
jgi:uncharacterized membrane protein YraQ (UPF0718 family)